VFAIQDEIAASVARALSVILSDTDRRAFSRASTRNVEAWEHYLRGRQFFHQARRRSLEYARQMFEQAIALDPDFALAHAGVADACSTLHMYYRSAAPMLEVADAASRRALELSPDLPEAHAARAFALFQLGRLDEAAGEFRTAIATDPHLAEARYFYGRQCFQEGKFTEAAHWFEESARVQEDSAARFFAAQALEAGGRREEAQAAYARALAVAERHLALNPDDPRTATMRAVALCRLGRLEEGLEWARRRALQRGLPLRPRGPAGRGDRMPRGVRAAGLRQPGVDRTRPRPGVAPRGPALQGPAGPRRGLGDGALVRRPRGAGTGATRAARGDSIAGERRVDWTSGRAHDALARGRRYPRRAARGVPGGRRTGVDGPRE
jgi:Tfp pilus assembly protein PilF